MSAKDQGSGVEGYRGGWAGTVSLPAGQGVMMAGPWGRPITGSMTRPASCRTGRWFG